MNKMNKEMKKEILFHVEVCQYATSCMSREEIENMVYIKLQSMEEVSLDVVLYGQTLVEEHMIDESLVNTLAENYKDIEKLIEINHDIEFHIKSIVCSSEYLEKKTVNLKELGKVFYYYHIYRLNEGSGIETIKSDSDELPVMSRWVLPSKEFHTLWENLYYDSNIKNNLLHFVKTTIHFSCFCVNSNIINWNKVVLLYGPPGTGKTSLCKALAQKAVIHLGRINAEFIEINSHSLFSKWFSESGKLVMKLFDEIKSTIQDKTRMLFILIDEIESLAHARKFCSNGNEPSDSIRAVNAFLTQLDQLKQYSNVLILTTSNMTQAIDLAFIDRADIKQYLGYPSESAIYRIYYSCLKELIRVTLLPFTISEDINKQKEKLLELCRNSKGLSGRTLRKIPFLAYTTFIAIDNMTLAKLIEAMHLVVLKQNREKTDFCEEKMNEK